MILDYQFCACVMRISSVPQLQVIHMERLYSYKRHIIYDRWFTITLLTSGFGQVWAKLGLQKSRATLGEIVGLHNCAAADKGSIDEYYGDLGKSGLDSTLRNMLNTIRLCKPGFTKSHRSLDNIVSLENGITYEIA